MRLSVLLGLFLVLTSCVTKKSEPPVSNLGKEDVFKLVTGKCTTYSFKDRGKAPLPFLKGMALMYARSICAANAGWFAAQATSQKNRNNPTYDTLTNYAPRFKNLGIAIDKDGHDTLRAVYVLGIGLGMRESNGKYCTGRDASASNVNAAEAEAGLFQFSYNSISAHTQLKEVYAKYKTDPSQCELKTFAEGISCKTSDAKNWGTGEGATFQKLAKECPAFAVEYAMLTLRTLFRHYGPLVRGEAELEPSCNDMLKNVEELVIKNPQMCFNL